MMMISNEKALEAILFLHKHCKRKLHGSGFEIEQLIFDYQISTFYMELKKGNEVLGLYHDGIFSRLLISGINLQDFETEVFSIIMNDEIKDMFTQYLKLENL